MSAHVYHGCGHYVVKVIERYDCETRFSEGWVYEREWHHPMYQIGKSLAERVLK